MQEARERALAAIRAGNAAEARRWVSEYKAGEASLARSKANIARDKAREGPGGTFLEGIGGGMLNVARHATQLLTPKDNEDAMGRFLGVSGDRGLQSAIDEQKKLDEAGSGRFHGGKFVGEIVATAPVGGVVGGAVRGAGTGLLRRSLANAAEGAVGGSLTSDQPGLGAVVGASTLPAMRLLSGLGRFLGRGLDRTKDSGALIDAGAKLDLGQMNPGGWIDRAIKAAENAPLGLGAGIRGAREDALRPVIPNVAADVAGIARPGATSAREGVDQALKDVEGRFKYFVDETPLSPGQSAELAAGRRGAANAAQVARETSREGVAESKQELLNAVDTAKARVLKTKARKVIGPEAREAKKLDLGVARSKLGQAQNDLSNFFVTPLQINKPAHRAIREFRSGSHRDLLSSMKINPDSKVGKALTRSISDVFDKMQGRGFGVGSGKGYTPRVMKNIAAELKAEARAIKEGKSIQENARQHVRALNRAAGWFESQIKEAIRASGKSVDDYEAANTAYKGLQGLATATTKTGATAHGLIDPTKMERELIRSIGQREWLRGEGGPLRDVTEALKRLEISSLRDGGTPQAASLPSQIGRIFQGTVGVPLSSRSLGYLGRGEHALGRTLRNMDPRLSRALEAVGALHHGVPGAVVSQ